MSEAGTPAPAVPRQRRPLARRTLRLFLLAIVIGLLGLWYTLETDTAAERLRLWMERTATAAIGAPAAIASLDLDVLPFRLLLTGVVVGDPGAPIASVDRLRLELSPWGFARRQIVITRLDLEQPVLDLTAIAPRPGTGLAAGSLPAVQVVVRRLRIHAGQLSFAGMDARLDGELTGIDLDLAPETGAVIDTLRPISTGQLLIAGGRLGFSGPDRQPATLDPVGLDAIFAVRGTTVQIASLHASAGDSSVAATGVIRGLSNADLALDADLALIDVFAAWTPPGPADHGGRTQFRGDLQLRNGTPFLSGRLRAFDARMSGVPLDRVVADLVLAPDSIALRNADLDLYGGNLGGTFDLDRSVSPPRIEIEFDARQIDAAAMTAWNVLPGWRLAGRVSGAGHLGWSDPFLATAGGAGQVRIALPDAATPRVAHDHSVGGTAGGASGEVLPVPSLPIPATVALGYELTDGALRLDGATVQLPGSTIRVDGEVDLDGAVGLTARIESRDIRQIDHIVAQYRAYHTLQASGPRLGLRGGFQADLRIGGTVAAPVVSGSVTTTDLGAGDLEIGAAAATLTTSAIGRLEARPLRISRRAGTATGAASIGIPTRGYDNRPARYDLRLRLDRYDLGAEVEVARLDRPLSGILDGSIALSGAAGAIERAEVELTATTPSIAGVDLDSATVSATRERGEWTISTLEIGGLGGTLEASGRFPAAGGVEGAILRARSIDLALIGAAADRFPDASGILDLDARLDGLLDALDGTASLRLADARLGATTLGSVAATARIDGGEMVARVAGSLDSADPAMPSSPRPTAHLRAPETTPPTRGGWSAGLAASSRSPLPMAVRLDADMTAIAAALAGAGRPLPDGILAAGTLRVEASGLAGAFDSFSGTARIVDGALSRGRVVLRSPVAEATFEAGLLEGRVRLTSGGARLDIEGRIDGVESSIDATAKGQLDLAAAGLWDPAVEASGRLWSDVRIEGPLERPTVSGTLEASELTFDSGAGYPVSEARVRAVLTGSSVELEEITGRLAGSHLSGRGQIPVAVLLGRPAGAAATLEITVESLPLEPLIARSETIARLVSGGTVDATIQLRGDRGDPRSWTGQVDLEAVEVRMRDYRLGLREPVVAHIRDGALMLSESTVLTDGRTALSLSGRVGLSPLELDIAARGPVGFEPLNVLSPYWGTGGIAEVDLRIRGQAPDLAYRGTALLSDVVLSPPPLRQPVEGISARLVFEDRRVRVEEVEGRLGGGRVFAEGEMFLRESVPQSFRFAIDVRDALLRLERDVRVEASADLIYDGTPERSLLSGEVRLTEGTYRRSLEANDALLELLAGPETDPSPLLTSIALDVRVAGSGNLFVDNNLADVEVTADFDLRGSLAKPVVLGRSRLLGGRLFWNGNTFEVLQGIVEFSNPFETEPIFEIRSRTEIRRYTIDLNFSGSLTRGVSFDYTSTPPLSDLDLFNLLAFGEDPESAVLQDPYRYQTALGLQATRYLADAYLTEVERGAERLFGVDRFRISPTLSGSDADATARLTLGKRLNRNLYVTYSRLLNTSEDQLLTVEYQLSPELRIKGTRDEDGSFGVDILIQKRIR